MILWVDAQISPRLCPWLSRQFRIDVIHVRDLGLRHAEDPQIFDRARKPGIVVFTKDEDFVDIVRRVGVPPQVLWLTCGNVSNLRLKAILSRTFPDAIHLLEHDEPIVEICHPDAFGPKLGRRKPSSRRARGARG